MARTARLAFLVVLAEVGLFGCGGKVADGTGNSSTGGTTTGGISTGGTANGGYVSGGRVTGGNRTGGYVSGGTATGGTANGGYVSGGSPAGGSGTGGATTGGYVTGGATTGGLGTGGSGTGGTMTGGRATGGIRTGGTWTGGRGTGGSATGGTGPVSVCQTVTTLPQQYSTCGATPGESRCLANGDRCVCARNIWYCNTACPSAQPNPDGDCSNHRGAACTYGNGMDCVCVNDRWMCLDTSDTSQCPTAIPAGDPCPGQIGLACDYPSLSPHQACVCVSEADGGNPTWTCVVSGTCPATQPVYRTACTSTRLCTYGNLHCLCMNGGDWICLPL